MVCLPYIRWVKRVTAGSYSEGGCVGLSLPLLFVWAVHRARATRLVASRGVSRAAVLQLSAVSLFCSLENEFKVLLYHQVMLAVPRWSLEGGQKATPVELARFVLDDMRDTYRDRQWFHFFALP